MNETPIDSELKRLVKAQFLPAEPVTIEASDSECVALATRFDLERVETLKAKIALEQDRETVMAQGTLAASFIQNCAISGDGFPVSIKESINLRFIPADAASSLAEDAEEIELSDDDCDEITYSGDSFDLGEAVAQTLGLAIDPYAEGPMADEARKKAGLSSDDAPTGPLAEALSALKKD